MKTVNYNDGMLERRRSKRAGFILNGKYIPFDQAEEKKIAVIKKIGYKKAGIWSRTDYEITTNSATFVMGYHPFNWFTEDKNEMIEHIIKINQDIDNEITEEEAIIFLENEFPEEWAKALSKEENIGKLI